MRRLAPLLLFAAVLVTGCGSDSSGLDYSLRTPPPYVGGASIAPKGQIAVDRKMKPADANRYKGVIAAWANAVRRGDEATAAGFFDLPAVVYQPGHTALQVNTPQIAAAFNASLPCGAKLLTATPDGRYVVGTFVLVSVGTTKCAGAGKLARVGFVFGDVRHPHQFTEWWQVGTNARTGPAKRPKALTAATVSDFS